MSEKIKATPELLKEIVEEFPYINEYLWSDVHPIEIVAVKGNTIETKRMKVSKNKTKMEFIPGGFSAHCPNNHAQEYDYYSSTDAETTKFRIIDLFKTKRTNYNKETDSFDEIYSYYIKRNGITYHFQEHPYYHYDYNF